ncbi:hypothetical protein F4824DRAFT_122187 [Ustulina deusta]|nr:hypothetical protein F4824DRAFT_122187 [Ustulina deusta]
MPTSAWQCGLAVQFAGTERYPARRRNIYSENGPWGLWLDAGPSQVHKHMYVGPSRSTSILLGLLLGSSANCNFTISHSNHPKNNKPRSNIIIIIIIFIFIEVIMALRCSVCEQWIKTTGGTHTAPAHRKTALNTPFPSTPMLRFVYSIQVPRLITNVTKNRL